MSKVAMGKLLYYALLIFSVTCIALCSVWLVFVSICLIGTGGTYSRTYPDGSIACGIPIFTWDTWFWPVFQFFGGPLVLVLASWRTIAYCRRELTS